MINSKILLDFSVSLFTIGSFGCTAIAHNVLHQSRHARAVNKVCIVEPSLQKAELSYVTTELLDVSPYDICKLCKKNYTGLKNLDQKGSNLVSL